MKQEMWTLRSLKKGDFPVGCGYQRRIDWRGKILVLEGQVEGNGKENSQKSEGDML